VDQQDAGRHCQHPSLAHASAHSTVTTQTICLFPMIYVMSAVAICRQFDCFKSNYFPSVFILR
jgi:hypothetical protein